MDLPPPLEVAVLAWGGAHLRDLPWRRSRDPWAVLVSELMLQQTQVARVLPRYHEFLAAYPTPEACAAVGRADVVRRWDGLGYNRRAVHLHQAAEAVVAAGAFPSTLAGLIALPGVGPYTARAVLAYAFEADAAVVDTNVARVLARLHGRTLTAKEAQAAADDLVPAGEAWLWNQAMTDVGARRCRPRQPGCDECPLAPWCAWHKAGYPAPDPAIGSAHVSGPQSPLAGSDREGRGRLVAALRRGPVAIADLPAVMGWPDDPGRAARVAEGLVSDGLVVVDDEVTLLDTSGGEPSHRR
ncbi:MAG TPA: A/G-specific adenine glycosylase [Acidimicrobiales bacterium]|nr:A/G-specific adenine glycosylase [Acidimicrobiales bacterium]